MGLLKPSRTLVFILLVVSVTCLDTPMSKEEREELKEEARDMFYHAYRAYMENAYPADELMPLTCQGRYRGLQPSRGDMDEILGNFSLTLIDTLDTLVILGDLEEFEHGVKLIIRDVTFDTDVIVSVFETNIRVLGGLLSGHILTEYLQDKAGIMGWYRGELLQMAKDLGYRLLPAFNTTTGIPYSKVNLMHGLKLNRLGAYRETCTACAGTMILEMAALSRLTGEPIFEEKAHRAMDELWKMRHRSSDLMGTVLNVHSGDWIRRDSGVGAGIDSYYEYCLKAYILLGDERYLNRFNRHYNAVMKYISQGPMLLDVHMHRPHTNSRNFMDALLAFWPGLQVLKGDIKPAVETHEMLYQVMQRHTFIPEAFTTDFQIHWSSHPLRPEFLESTYFLHRATNDPYYLEVGKKALKSLQKHARVPCGYAAVNDVRTGKHEDRMDSFVLAETFKYLYLLFVDESELILDLNDFIFTTEAHLLPLSLAKPDLNVTRKDLEDQDDSNFGRICPSTVHLLPESLRKPLRNMVDGICPKKTRRRLTAAEFQVSDPHHLSIIKDMGINIMSLNDGRIQLLHSFSSARSISDAEEGIVFMQEMLQLSKAQADQPEYSQQSVVYSDKSLNMFLKAGPSHFGPELRGNERVSGPVVLAKPIRACDQIPEPSYVKNKIVIMERGDCMFVDKARQIQAAGAIAGIVVDNVPNSSSLTSPFFAMSGDGNNDVKIPVVFLFTEDANKLLKAVEDNPELLVSIGEYGDSALLSIQHIHNLNSIIQKEKFSFKVGDFSAVHDQQIFVIVYEAQQKPVSLEKSDKPPNLGWYQIREHILQSIFRYSKKKFFIGPETVTLLYNKYSGYKDEDLSVHFTWLLTELQRHFENNLDLPTRPQQVIKPADSEVTALLVQLVVVNSAYKKSLDKIEVVMAKEFNFVIDEKVDNDDIVVTNQKIKDEL